MNAITTILLAMLAASTPEPNLCDIAGGRYCMSCGDPDDASSPPCVGEDEGWLCCSGGVCVVVATYDAECSGDVGWCANYFTETLRNGVEVAYCEDG
jgi:hypothetical protein